MQKVAKSLREFGWRQPILVDKDDVIIVGHGRWMAYNKYPSGIKEPWIEKAVDLSPEFFGDRKQYTEWTEEMSDEELLKMVKGMVTKEEEGDSTVWRLHREMKYDHPTQKPVKLVSIAIRNSSKRGDVVLDLFGGSFSTMVAAHELSRTCWTMELDPRYVDVGIKRMLQLDPTLELKRDGVVIDKTPWLK